MEGLFLWAPQLGHAMPFYTVTLWFSVRSRQWLGVPSILHSPSSPWLRSEHLRGYVWSDQSLPIPHGPPASL